MSKNEKKDLRMVQINGDTHKKLKIKSAEKDMTLKAYIDYLLTLDK